MMREIKLKQFFVCYKKYRKLKYNFRLKNVHINIYLKTIYFRLSNMIMNYSITEFSEPVIMTMTRVGILFFKTLVFLLVQNLTNCTNVTLEDKKIYLGNMKKLLDDLVVGFDCSKPLNLTSHSFEGITVCEEGNTNIEREEENMQILQKSNLYSIKAIS